MSTIRYTDYLTNVSNGTLNLDDIWYSVYMVSDEYVPSEIHKPADIQKYIIKAVGVLTKDEVKKLSMSEILDKAKDFLRTGIQMFPQEICEHIDGVISDPVKREKLKDLIRMPGGDSMREGQYWQDFKENGVGYFVFESPVHGCLCFCEEVTL